MDVDSLRKLGHQCGRMFSLVPRNRQPVLSVADNNTERRQATSQRISIQKASLHPNQAVQDRYLHFLPTPYTIWKQTSVVAAYKCNPSKSSNLFSLNDKKVVVKCHTFKYLQAPRSDAKLESTYLSENGRHCLIQATGILQESKGDPHCITDS